MKKTVTLIGALLLICALLLGCDLPAPEPIDTTQIEIIAPVGSIQESTDDPEPTTEQPTEQPTEEPTWAPETDAPTTEETTEDLRPRRLPPKR